MNKYQVFYESDDGREILLAEFDSMQECKDFRRNLKNYKKQYAYVVYGGEVLSWRSK